MYDTLLWKNRNCAVKVEYYSREKVCRFSVAIRDYKNKLRAQRRAFYEKQKGKLLRLSLPADTWNACTLTDYYY